MFSIAAKMAHESEFGDLITNFSNAFFLGKDLEEFRGMIDKHPEYIEDIHMLMGTTILLAVAGVAASFAGLTIQMSIFVSGIIGIISISVSIIMDIIEEKIPLWMKFLIDPSGYVYEAVDSNRVEGITTTVYYKDENGQAVKWNAEEYDQVNPLITDKEGKYAWDVPEGM